MTQALGDEKPEATSSIEDEVAAVYNELYGKKEETEEPEAEPQSEAATEEPIASETEPEGEVEETEEAAPVEESADIPPPNDWSAEAKQWFKQQPKEAKAETKRIADEFQNWRKKTINEIRSTEKALEQERSEISDCVKIVGRWLPRWGLKGVTPEQAITQLCTFNELAIKDTRSAIRELATRAGISVKIEGEGSENSGKIQPTVLEDVDNRVNNAINSRLGAISHQQQAATLKAEIDAALDELTNEMGEAGRYVYPDFHNLEFQRNDIEPLAQGIWRANPNLTAKDMLLRAYKAAGGRVLPKMTARLNGNRKTELAKRAASSISGSFARTSEDDIEFVPGESIEDTVRRVYQAARTNSR